MNSVDQVITSDHPKTREVLHCVWMDAGVVDYKLCDRDYDCEQCPFDEVLHGYPVKVMPAAPDSNGCKVANDVFYDPGHIWSRVEEGGMVRLGLDDFSQRLLGAAYSLSLPDPESHIKRGDACCHFTHQAGVAALFSPVSGRVAATNLSLLARPTLVNRDPYRDGWLMLVEPTDLKSCLKRSLYGDQVAPWLAQEVEKLHLIVSGILNQGQNEPTLMDGGLLSRQFLQGLSVEQTRRVISSFFPLSTEEAEPKSAILISNRR